MQIRTALLSLPVFLLAGCASQQATQDQASALQHQLDELRQAQAGIATSQHNLDIRLSALESSQTGNVNQSSLLTHQLDTRLSALEATNAGLSSRFDQNGTALQNTQEQLRSLSNQVADLSSTSAKATQDVQSMHGELSGLSTRVGDLDASNHQATEAVASMQKQVADMNERLVTAATQSSAASAVAARAQETSEDAIKIARDSRTVAGKVVDSLTLTQDMISYDYEDPSLTPSGKLAMDSLIERIKPLMPNAFVEIIGFTDDLSLTSHNRRVALERAESVRRYLREKGGIPLHRMSSISYGDLDPLVSNDNPERSKNRRVVVQVLK